MASGPGYSSRLDGRRAVLYRSNLMLAFSAVNRLRQTRW